MTITVEDIGWEGEASVLPAPLPRAADPARARAFARAVRHSARVRVLRVALPLFGLLLAIGVIGYSAVVRFGVGLPFGIDGLALTGEGLTMASPDISGHDALGRSYQVTADRAVQDLADPGIIRMFGVEARFTEPDGVAATFTADEARYDSDAEQLTLAGNIRIASNGGDSAELSRAVIDLAAGTVDSDAPVAFTSSFGAISAGTMSIERESGTVQFQDRVRMTINPDAPLPGTAPAAARAPEAP